jgi:dTMP kinase
VTAGPARGRFITFEGGEGAGKSTQAKLLKERLEGRGTRAVLTREPGGSAGAEQIRKLLVEGEPERWTAMTETLLFLAARSDHVAKLIAPALADGAWVICDRFIDSTLVYQGVARGLGLERVRALQTAALGDIVPDLTLILDLAPDAGLARTQNRSGDETRFERFEAEFHARLRAAFREIAAEEPGRCVVIDASRSRDEVASEIWRTVTTRLQP